MVAKLATTDDDATRPKGVKRGDRRARRDLTTSSGTADDKLEHH